MSLRMREPTTVTSVTSGAALDDALDEASELVDDEAAPVVEASCAVAWPPAAKPASATPQIMDVAIRPDRNVILLTRISPGYIGVLAHPPQFSSYQAVNGLNPSVVNPSIGRHIFVHINCNLFQ